MPRIARPKLRRMRRRGWNIGQHEADELGFVFDPKRRVVSPFEADGGHGLAAQAASADRPRKGPWHDLQMIGEGLQAPQAPEQHAGSVFGARGKLGPADIAYHQGMPGQREPRIARAGPIGDDYGQVHWGVPRCVEDFSRDVTEREHIVIVNASERNGRVGFSEQHVLGVRGLRQASPTRDMVGMNVRVDDVENTHTSVPGCIDIRRDVAQWVDHGGRGLASAAEEVGDRDEIGV